MTTEPTKTITFYGLSPEDRAAMRWRAARCGSTLKEAYALALCDLADTLEKQELVQLPAGFSYRRYSVKIPAETKDRVDRVISSATPPIRLGAFYRAAVYRFLKKEGEPSAK